MDRIRRTERLAVMSKILMDSPNRIFTLGTFCEKFGSAKSSLSEDIDILRTIFAQYGLGVLETVTGAAGGVRYRPTISDEAAVAAVADVVKMLSSPGRVLPGGFIYMADILAMPDVVEKMGNIIATQFYKQEPDFVLTMETKGIPVALMTAEALHVPLTIARHSSKVYEGSAVNINYVSGKGVIETMSLSRRAVKEGSTALIVDDFMRAGGTVSGLCELAEEVGAEVVGTYLFIASREPEKKIINEYASLMTLQGVDAETKAISIVPEML